MYKTGDAGKWLPEGNIEFLGRLDSQVKVNGYRTEISEVERKLSEYPRIKDAVVVLKEDPSTKLKFLAAYLLSDEKKIDSNTFRKEITKHLPQFMVPAYILPMNKFPLRVNGKTDRQKLASIPVEKMQKVQKVEMLLNGARAKNRRTRELAI